MLIAIAAEAGEGSAFAVFPDDPERGFARAASLAVLQDVQGPDMDPAGVLKGKVTDGLAPVKDQIHVTGPVQDLPPVPAFVAGVVEAVDELVRVDAPVGRGPDPGAELRDRAGVPLLRGYKGEGHDGDTSCRALF